MAMTFRKGNLEILLDKVAFDGGETINGVVVLYVTKVLECEDLELVVHGSENMQWCVRFEGTNLGLHETNELLHLKTILSSCHAFEPGEYEFPFSYHLPEKLPASFANYGEKAHFNNPVTLNPRVSYVVMAYLPVTTNFSSDLEATQSFAIFTRVHDLPQGQFINTKVSSAIKLSGFINKGVCTLSARPDQHTYSAGEHVNVKLMVANASALKVSWIRMELGEHFVFAHSEGQVQGTNWLRETKAAGVRAGETVDRTLSVPLVAKSSGNPIHPTTPTSDTLQRTYRLVITCHFALAKDIKMEIPIVVRPQEQPVDE